MMAKKKKGEEVDKEGETEKKAKKKDDKRKHPGEQGRRDIGG